MADSGKLALRSRVAEDAVGVDAGGRGEVTEEKGVKEERERQERGEREHRDEKEWKSKKVGG